MPDVFDDIIDREASPADVARVATIIASALPRGRDADCRLTRARYFPPHLRVQ
jgi:hypothetical protein